MLPQLRADFGIAQLVMVGERALLGQQAIEQMRDAGGIQWITPLKNASIRVLVEQAHLQLGLFDERNLFEFSSPGYPGERRVACRNRQLATLRAHKREALPAATEKSLHGRPHRAFGPGVPDPPSAAAQLATA